PQRGQDGKPRHGQVEGGEDLRQLLLVPVVRAVQAPEDGHGGGVEFGALPTPLLHHEVHGVRPRTVPSRHCAHPPSPGEVLSSKNNSAKRTSGAAVATTSSASRGDRSREGCAGPPSGWPGRPLGRMDSFQSSSQQLVEIPGGGTTEDTSRIFLMFVS